MAAISSIASLRMDRLWAAILASLGPALRGMASRLVLPLLAVTVPAHADRNVSLELVLAVDVSVSVNDLEYGLQMAGISTAFRDPEIIDLIKGHEKGVAVLLTQWSGAYEARVPLPWTLLSDDASIVRFANAVRSIPPPGTGNFTGVGNAIAFAVEQITGNEFEGEEKKIDISGDGKNNSGPEPAVTRLMAYNNDITINGLAITDSDPQLDSYYRNHVITGTNAFVVVAKNFEAFSEAFRRKLKRELSPKTVLIPNFGRIAEARE